jgi:hypothetical protein
VAPCTGASAARLRIQAATPALSPGHRAAALIGGWRGLQRLVGRAPGRDGGEALVLQIDVLGGEAVLALDDAGPVVELPLPPGTYQVSARRGAVQRAYTLALEPGQPYTLVLDIALRPPSA